MTTTLVATRAKQKVATKSVSVLDTKQSLELIRCLTRVSVFNVCHLRGLFPDKCFKPVEMANLDGLRVCMLLPATPEAAALAEWVDHGVSEALHKGYLASMTFSIAATPDLSELLETYTFKFTYAEDGAVPTVDLVRGGAAAAGEATTATAAAATAATRLAPRADATLASVKANVVTLIRSVIQLCSTLAPVPDSRSLFIKLTYREGVTPPYYEPPGFAPAPDAVRNAFFPSKPFSYAPPPVVTPAHAVGLTLASTLDRMTTGGVGGGSQPVPADSVGVTLSALMTGADGRAPPPPPPPPPLPPGPPATGLAAVDEEEEGEDSDDDGDEEGTACVASQPAGAAFELVVDEMRAYCLGRASTAAAQAAADAAAAAAAAAAAPPPPTAGGGRRRREKVAAAAPPPLPPPPPAAAAPTVEYTDLMARFPHLSAGALDAGIAALVDQGLLASADGGRGDVLTIHPPLPPRALPSGATAGAMPPPPPPPPPFSAMGGIRSDGGGSVATHSKRRLPPHPYHAAGHGPSQASVGGDNLTAPAPRPTAQSGGGGGPAVREPVGPLGPPARKRVKVSVAPAGRGGGGGRGGQATGRK